MFKMISHFLTYVCVYVCVYVYTQCIIAFYYVCETASFRFLDISLLLVHRIRWIIFNLGVPCFDFLCVWVFPNTQMCRQWTEQKSKLVGGLFLGSISFSNRQDKIHAIWSVDECVRLKDQKHSWRNPPVKDFLSVPLWIWTLKISKH